MRLPSAFTFLCDQLCNSWGLPVSDITPRQHFACAAAFGTIKIELACRRGMAYAAWCDCTHTAHSLTHTRTHTSTHTHTDTCARAHTDTHASTDSTQHHTLANTFHRQTHARTHRRTSAKSDSWQYARCPTPQSAAGSVCIIIL